MTVRHTNEHLGLYNWTVMGNMEAWRRHWIVRTIFISSCRFISNIQISTLILQDFHKVVKNYVLVRPFVDDMTGCAGESVCGFDTILSWLNCKSRNSACALQTIQNCLLPEKSANKNKHSKTQSKTTENKAKTKVYTMEIENRGTK